MSEESAVARFLLVAVSHRFGRADDALQLCELSGQVAPEEEPLLRESAAYHELAPLLHLVAEDCSGLGSPLRLSARTLEEWAAVHHREVVRSALILHAARRGIAALVEAGVRVIPLKGIHLSSRYYRKPSARAFQDFDLLVEEPSLSRLDAALREAGFQPCPGRPSFVPAPAHTVYRLPLEDGLTVVETDIHVGMHWPKEYDRRTRFRASDLWEGARREEWEGIPVWALRPEHLVVTVLLDLAVNHRYARLVKFRDLLEILESEELDWEEVVGISRRWEVASFVGTGMSYLQELGREGRVPPGLPEALTPDYPSLRLFRRLLPLHRIPLHRARSLTLPNLLFFLLADTARERLRGWKYVPIHIFRGVRHGDSRRR